MKHARITRALRAAAVAAAVTSLALADATGPATAAPNPVTAYIADAGSDTVTPILAATNIAGHPITVGDSPFLIAATSDGKTVYVITGSVVIPIRTATNTAGPPIPVGSGPDAIAITPDGKTAYVVDAGDDEDSGRVIPIQTATNTAGPPIMAGPVPYAIAIAP